MLQYFCWISGGLTASELVVTYEDSSYSLSVAKSSKFPGFNNQISGEVGSNVTSEGNIYVTIFSYYFAFYRFNVYTFEFQVVIENLTSVIGPQYYMSWINVEDTSIILQVQTDFIDNNWNAYIINLNGLTVTKIFRDSSLIANSIIGISSPNCGYSISSFYSSVAPGLLTSFNTITGKLTNSSLPIDALYPPYNAEATNENIFYSNYVQSRGSLGYTIVNQYQINPINCELSQSSSSLNASYPIYLEAAGTDQLYFFQSFGSTLKRYSYL